MPQGKTMELSQLRAICTDFASGKSFSNIKQNRNVAKSTLQKIKEKLMEHDLLDLKKLHDIADDDLVCIMYGDKSRLEPVPKSKSMRIVIDRKHEDRIDNEAMYPAHFEDLIRRFENNRFQTKEDLYRDYVEQAEQNGCTYYKRTTFMSRLNALIENRKGPDVYLHRQHAFGDELELDWCGQQVLVRTGASGQTQKCPVIVFVWAASNYVYAQVVEDMTTVTTCNAVKKALEFYDCLPLRLVIDNGKCMVSKHKKGQEAVFNENFFYFCERCGIGIDANNPASGNEKSAVENTVRLVEQRVLTRMGYASGTYSREEYNREMMKLVNKYINNASFRGGGADDSRASLFKKHDFPAALRIESPLPAYIEHHAFIKVKSDYHIELHGAKYSVPWRYADQYVNADIDGSVLTIYDYSNVTVLARHPVKAPGEYSTNQEHMPKHHQAVHQKELMYQNEQDVLDAATAISYQLESFCKFMLSRGNWFDDKKACINIINLYRRHKSKHDLYDQAIAKVLHEESPNRINSYAVKQTIREYEEYAISHNGKFPIQLDMFDDLEPAAGIDSDEEAACLRGAAGFKDLEDEFISK